MGELLVVAFLGGLITGISPCIVPVLPVVVAGGSTGKSRARPFLIITGLVVSFSVTELVGSTVLSALDLPQDLLFWLGIGLLLVLAAGLMIPVIGELVERPFNRLGASRYADSGGGFVLGLSLGLVFIPCAGPVLAAIAAAGANHHVNVSSLLVTLFYSVGAALPLLILSILAQRAVTGWQKLRTHLPTIRRVAGGVLAVTTLAIAFNLFAPLQRVAPSFSAALENHIEGTPSLAKQLQQLRGEKANKVAAAQAKANKHKTPTSSLPNLAKAPNFTGISAWLNTAGDAPLTLSALKGKVVLIDFWTYSCINCQRALPHVEGWYNDYKNDGLVVIGVHTPEFAFEHVLSNVRSAAGNLGVDYPIAVDNDYGTWDAYSNEYWPADYLIDSTGEIRAYSFGEGGYSTMESNIRSLLTASGAAHLPARTDVADKTPSEGSQLTPESYLGYSELNPGGFVGTAIKNDKATDYHAPSTIPPNNLAFNGNWTDHKQEATAGNNASLQLRFTADDVYLVIGGTGTVNVSYNGRHLSTVKINGIPKLYTMFSGSQLQSGLLTMSFSPGIEAYDFTFG